MTDAGTSEVPLSHKTVTEPNIIMQTRSEVDLLDDGQKVDKGNPHQGGNFICFYIYWCFVPMIEWRNWILRIDHYLSNMNLKIL